LFSKITCNFGNLKVCQSSRLSLGLKLEKFLWESLQVSAVAIYDISVSEIDELNFHLSLSKRVEDFRSIPAIVL
jgi:hypothetical protein